MGQVIRKKQGASTIISFEDEEPSIDDLLNDFPEPTAKLKQIRESTTRQTKGMLVTFTTKKGQRIIAPGVLYYVTKCNGRLHYKEASQVQLLPDDWEEGDEIPVTS